MTKSAAPSDFAVHDVTTYGAVGDGVADDTAAIRQALARALAAPRGEVYFPAGTYNVCRPESDRAWPSWPVIFLVKGDNRRIRFRGEGQARSIIRCFMPGLVSPLVHWEPTGDSYMKISRFTAIDVTGNGLVFDIDDLTIDGQAGYTGDFGVGGNVRTGDGWDMTHKAIRVTSGTRMEVNIRGSTLKNWRGEIVWAGNHNALVSTDGATLLSSNASAFSVTHCRVKNSTLGGSGANRVYNGVENFSFAGEGTVVSGSVIEAHSHGVVYIGQEGASCTIAHNTFQNCNKAILFSEGAWNVDIEGNSIADCQVGAITSFLKLYPGKTQGFGNIKVRENVSNMRTGQTLFANQGQTVKGYVTFEANTINGGMLIAGGFNESQNFTVTGTVLNNDARDAGLGAEGARPLWTDTVRNVKEWWRSTGTRAIDFSGVESLAIHPVSDLVLVSENRMQGRVMRLIIGNAANIPEGQVIAFVQDNRKYANWVLPADPAWNDFTADVPLGAVYVPDIALRLIKSGGKLRVKV